MALTYPGIKSLSPVGGANEASGIFGVLDVRNRYSVLLPIAGMFITGALNMAYLGPVTTKVMKERKHQETKDGKKYYDQGEHSKEMLRLNKRFSRLHGASALVNLFGAGIMLWYGVLLAERLQ